MKRPECSKCKKKIGRTFGVHIKSDSLYYLKRDQLGQLWYAWGYKVPRKKETLLHLLKRNDCLLDMYCRHCKESFDESTKKSIFKWLLQKKLLDKFTQNASQIDSAH